MYEYGNGPREVRTLNAREITDKNVALIAHIDDLLIVGDVELAHLFDELKTKVLLKLVGAAKVGSEFTYVGRTLKMIEDG